MRAVQPDPIDDFWAATELNDVTVGEFVARLNAFPPTDDSSHPWARAGQPHALGDVPAWPRRSTRAFGDRALTGDEVALVLRALAGDESGRRAYAGAGALYSVRAVAFLLHCDHPLNGRLALHHPGQHALYDIAACPDWADLAEVLGGRDADGTPALAIALVADESTLRAKYGPRGTRFALLEAGAALHQLALATAEAGLAGYATGGGLDTAVCALARLPRSARFIAGYLVGPGARNDVPTGFGVGAWRQRRKRARPARPE